MKISKIIKSLESTKTCVDVLWDNLYDFCFSPHLAVRAISEKNLIKLCFAGCECCSSRIGSNCFMGLSLTGLDRFDKVPSKESFIKSVSESDVEFQIYLS